MLDNLYIIDFYIWDYWPLLLILGGLALIRSTRKPRVSRAPADATQAGTGSSTVNGFALLGGQHLTNTSDDFQGGTVTAILGGGKIDLRAAAMKRDTAVLELFTLWGGIEVLVPATWNVQLEGFPILGGFEDKTHPNPAQSDKRIIIRGTAIMGGIEVRN